MFIELYGNRKPDFEYQVSLTGCSVRHWLVEKYWEISSVDSNSRFLRKYFFSCQAFQQIRLAKFQGARLDFCNRERSIYIHSVSYRDRVRTGVNLTINQPPLLGTITWSILSTWTCSRSVTPLYWSCSRCTRVNWIMPETFMLRNIRGQRTNKSCQL